MVNSWAKPKRRLSVDWGNSINRGSTGIWLPGEGLGLTRDLTGNNNGDEIGNIARDLSPTGQAAYVTSDATTNRVNLGSIPSSNPLSGSAEDEISVFAQLYIDDSTSVHGNNFPRIIDKSSSGSATNGWAFYLDLTSSPGEFAFQVNGSSTFWPMSFVESIDRVGTLGFSYSDVTGDVSGYHNGILSSTTSTPLTIAIPTTTTNAALLNWNHASDRQYRRPVYIIRVWNRVVTAAEFEILARYPYAGLNPFDVPQSLLFSEPSPSGFSPYWARGSNVITGLQQ